MKIYLIAFILICLIYLISLLCIKKEKFSNLVVNLNKDYEFILICATGRSGSTTLQQIINTIPESNICGENHGAINHLLEFYKSIKVTFKNSYNKKTKKMKTYDYLQKHKIKPSWYNIFNFNKIKNNIKYTIVQMLIENNKNQIIGFKEIRYDNEKINLIKEFKELFPNTKVIVHYRNNISEQLKSKKKSQYKAKKLGYNFFEKYNNELSKFAKENKDFCYESTFEDLFDKNKVHNIFKFLNKDFNLNEYNKIINSY